MNLGKKQYQPKTEYEKLVIEQRSWKQKEYELQKQRETEQQEIFSIQQKQIKNDKKKAKKLQKKEDFEKEPEDETSNKKRKSLSIEATIYSEDVKVSRD